jgi:hypothetical protein
LQAKQSRKNIKHSNIFAINNSVIPAITKRQAFRKNAHLPKLRHSRAGGNPKEKQKILKCKNFILYVKSEMIK